MALAHGFDLARLTLQFVVEGTFLDAVPHGSGHINQTYRVRCVAAGTVLSYLLQRINTDVFQRPDLLMQNVERVTAHIAAKLTGEHDAARRVATLVRTMDGCTWHQHPDGSCWRMFHFLADTASFDAIETAAQAFRAAQAFGHFQHLLSDLPAPRLHETIPDFHDTPLRFRALDGAIAADVANRAALARDEIEWLLAQRSTAHELLNAGLPERVTHNDTKLNNVLFDAATGEALCVIDLDTVMPGLALYDFGDMVRTATSPTAEDEQDLSRVGVQLPLFEALVKGYLSSAAAFLTPAEKQLLPVAGKVIAYEQAVRFLTDYLAGDVYYKVTRPEQNLQRCRTQLRLLQSMDQQQQALHRIVTHAAAEPQ
ncbi:MAG: phosphotransferase enzyme family protein [Janthinobacterium lividum]